MRIAKGWAALLPLMAGLSATAPAMAQGAGTSREDYLAQVTAAVEQADTDRYDEACVTMRRLRDDRTFDALPSDLQSRVLAEAGYVYLACNKPAEALPELKASVAIAQDPWNLTNLALAAEAVGEAGTLARTIIEFTSGWPQALDDAWTRRAWSAFNGLGDNPALQRQLFQALFDADTVSPTGDNSAMWYELARLYLDAGDTDLARNAASRVRDGTAVLRMRIDRRFDPIVVRDAPRFDARRQAEALVGAQRARGSIRQQDIAVWTELAFAQLVVGDHQGVIDEATRVLGEFDASVQPDGSAPGWLNVDYLAWLLNGRAIAHARMGNVGLAIADLSLAAAMPEQGGPNVSQRINLAVLLCFSGRADEAEQQMRAMPSGVTTWVQVQQSLVRLCVAAQRGDRGAMQAQYAFIQRSADEADAASRLRASLYMGDLDAAEREYLQLLEHPVQRGDALLMAQRGARPRGMPGRAILDRNRDALFARPAVKAAIERLGRVEQTTLYTSQMFD